MPCTAQDACGQLLQGVEMLTSLFQPNAQTGMPSKCAGGPVSSLNRMAAELYDPQSCATEALVPAASPMVTLLPIKVGRLLFLGLCLATWMITLSWMLVFSPTLMLCTSPAGTGAHGQ